MIYSTLPESIGSVLGTGFKLAFATLIKLWCFFLFLIILITAYNYYSTDWSSIKQTNSGTEFIKQSIFKKTVTSNKKFEKDFLEFKNDLAEKSNKGSFRIERASPNIPNHDGNSISKGNDEIKSLRQPINKNPTASETKEKVVDASDQHIKFPSSSSAELMTIIIVVLLILFPFLLMLYLSMIALVVMNSLGQGSSISFKQACWISLKRLLKAFIATILWFIVFSLIFVVFMSLLSTHLIIAAIISLILNAYPAFTILIAIIGNESIVGSLIKSCQIVWGNLLRTIIIFILGNLSAAVLLLIILVPFGFLGWKLIGALPVGSSDVILILFICAIAAIGWVLGNLILSGIMLAQINDLKIRKSHPSAL